MKESGATRLKNFWEKFGDAPVGCEGHGEIAYKWRANDWENNLIDLLVTWSGGILGGNLDIAVILEPGSCTRPSGCDAEDRAGTTAESGWSPFFLPMPHLCVFDTQQDWEDYLAASDVAPEVRQDAVSNLDKGVEEGEDRSTISALENGGTDLVQSMTMGLDRLLSSMQPRVTDEVRSFLAAPDTANFTTVDYVGMHVRDIPPRMFGTFKATETLDCFERVFRFFEDKDTGIRASDITGVWLVSEDDTSLPEAKILAKRYFRNAKAEHVVQIEGPTLPVTAADGADTSGQSLNAVENAAVVHLLAQLQVLSDADVFVGAFSENFSRLVFFRRETLRRKRATSMSTDKLSPFPV
eukprot:jgi/Undpi1/8457/HiC_scaffold_25.g10924.m1